MSISNALSSAVAALAESISPSVVHARALRTGRSGTATGSGVLIGRDGHVLTNGHVVSGATAVEADLAGGRATPGVIQTEAPPNPGSCGGPPRDGSGMAARIHTAIAAGAQGSCFAGPSNAAAFVAAECRAHGRVRRAWLGIAGEDVRRPAAIARDLGHDAARGVLVRRVDAGSPAAVGGVRERDVVVSLDGRPNASVADPHRSLGTDAIGSSAAIGSVREGARMSPPIRPLERVRRAR